MTSAVVVEYARTPFGRADRGALRDARSDELSGLVIRAVLDRVPQLNRAEIADVLWGCSLPHRSQGYNIGRQAGFLAGLPSSVPAITLARSCGSAMSGLRAATHAIQSDDGDVYVVGGCDSLSNCYGWTSSPDDENPRFLDESRADYAGDAYISVFDTAENVAEAYGISRQDMDAYTVRSQSLAAAAQRDGYLAEEIVPFLGEDGESVTDDDCLRPDTDAEILATLRPIRPDLGGRVTAGNTCVAADGAAALLVMSDTRAQDLGIRPAARVLSSAVSGCAPEMMGIGPVEASRKALAHAGVSISAIDVVECHENFAAQVLPVCHELEIDIDRQLNPFGGALALGHPPGATGARLVGTLMHALRERDGHLGLATTCIAGGMGISVVVERLS